MRDILCILLLSCITLSIALADTIHMKNGLKIDGEIAAVTADSVTIKTASGVLTIAATDIESVEMAQIQTQPQPPPREISEGAIPKSIKSVGYGCLGGLVLGGTASLLAVWTDGFGNNAYATYTVIIGSSIIGILIGANMGSK